MLAFHCRISSGTEIFFLTEGDSREPSERDVERSERHGRRGRLPQGQQGQGKGHRLHGAKGGQRQIRPTIFIGVRLREYGCAPAASIRQNCPFECISEW